MAKYILFSIGNNTAGIEIEKVAHILEINSLNTDFSEGIIKGVVVEQNNVFGVVDVRNRIDKRFISDKGNKILIVSISKNSTNKKQTTKIGFVVDVVLKIISVEKTDPFNEELINKNEVKQMIHIDDKIYPILDMSFFLNDNDLALIKKVINNYKKKVALEAKGAMDDGKKKTEKIFRKKKIEKIWKSHHPNDFAGEKK